MAQPLQSIQAGSSPAPIERRVAAFGLVPEGDQAIGRLPTPWVSLRMVCPPLTRLRPRRRALPAAFVLLAVLATVRAGSESPPTPARTAGRRSAPASGRGVERSAWQVGQAVAIAVDRGRAEFDVPVSDRAARTLV